MACESKIKGSSCKSATRHWMFQRASALALVPLVLWFVWQLMWLGNSDHTTVLRWISEPVRAVCLILFVALCFYHSYLGMEVIIDDYIHHRGIKIFSMLLLKFSILFTASAAIVAVLKIAL